MNAGDAVKLTVDSHFAWVVWLETSQDGATFVDEVTFEVALDSFVVRVEEMGPCTEDSIHVAMGVVVSVNWADN